ncbi:hypothetical protein Tco_1080380 [Tanacetum coccineum]|uniref:Uncharacterized protein n=1 Tax=Tanacetum coccineum TaxID=301880 RepID=A0ABQ5HV21_9ASTR
MRRCSMDKARRWLGVGVSMDWHKSNGIMQTTRYERLSMVREKRTVRRKVSPHVSRRLMASLYGGLIVGLGLVEVEARYANGVFSGVVAANTVVVVGGLSLVVMFVSSKAHREGLGIRVADSHIGNHPEGRFTHSETHLEGFIGVYWEKSIQAL